jgi:capsular polysaccharide biosynthesis protein
MELRDAGRRILWHYKILLVTMCIGALVARALAKRSDEAYIASTRIVISTTADSSVDADSVAAIATSVTQVQQVLQRVGVDRDPAVVAAGVSVRAIGTSGVVQLSVSDRDPDVAIALARALTSQTGSIMLSSGIVSSVPYLVDQAGRETTKAVSTDVVQDVALGVLAGLVLGLLLVAVAESFRPTVIGEDAIATEIGAPVLAVVPTLSALEGDDLTWVRWQLDASAKRANVDTVELTSVGPALDIAPLSESLTMTGRDDGDSGVVVHPLESDVSGPRPSSAAGLVIVSPIVLKKADLERVKDLMSVTGWPPIGVIGYRSRGGLGRVFRRSAPQPAEQAA